MEFRKRLCDGKHSSEIPPNVMSDLNVLGFALPDLICCVECYDIQGKIKERCRKGVFHSGCYLWVDPCLGAEPARMLYVGKTARLAMRIQQHLYKGEFIDSYFRDVQQEGIMTGLPLIYMWLSENPIVMEIAIQRHCQPIYNKRRD